jgi:hypothetical protein
VLGVRDGTGREEDMAEVVPRGNEGEETEMSTDDEVSEGALITKEDEEIGADWEMSEDVERDREDEEAGASHFPNSLWQTLAAQ